MKKNVYYTTNKPGAKRELILFFVITFAIMYGLGAVGVIFRSGIERVLGPISNQNLYITFLIYSPTISGLILTAVYEKRAGLIALFKRAVLSASPVWWAVSLLTFPAMWCVYGLFTKDFSWDSIYAGLPLALFSVGIIIDRGPLGEELGWRGFALPRLLQYNSPLVSTVILSVIWGLFHLPSFLTSGTVQSNLNVVWWSLALISTTFIMTWLYMRGGGNWVVAGIIPHYIFNTSFSTGVVSLGPGPVGVMLLATVMILIFDRRKFLESPEKRGQISQGKGDDGVMSTAG